MPSKLIAIRNIKRRLDDPLYNTFRAMNYTAKGKAIGCEWKNFEDFASDMRPTWFQGACISRFDKTKPFSKENTSWTPRGTENNPERLTKLEYKGEVKTLVEWADYLHVNYQGLRQRYFKGKNYTTHEILFGKKKRPKRELLCATELEYADKRVKASKMISSHRCRDIKRNLEPPDMGIDWFISNILDSTCVYCGTSNNVGADRIDNSIGHIKANLVPACYRCNTSRGDFFTHEEMLKIGAFLRDNIDTK